MDILEALISTDADGDKIGRISHSAQWALFNSDYEWDYYAIRDRVRAGLLQRVHLVDQRRRRLVEAPRLGRGLGLGAPDNERADVPDHEPGYQRGFAVFDAAAGLC
uniref:Uncharacterized protein n=1 Tax=Mycena chlorophos TaxID=658473 RepID=A0ABQ0L6P1_MYCCL|nr:predicted protein [Mycena chlorophos]